MRTFGLYIHGHFVHPGPLRLVRPPADPNQPFAQVGWLKEGEASSEEILEVALQGAWESFLQIQRGEFFPLDERLAFLEKLRTRLLDNLDFLATLISKEVGKPLRQARTEVRRAANTLHATLREAPGVLAPHGLPTNSSADLRHVTGFWKREPRGPLLAITPFNFPLNLVLHKLAPALAAGCPVLIKPSPKGAATAMALADACHAAGIPPGMLAVLNAEDSLVPRLIRDSRVKQVSFTGSAPVGWALRQEASLKPFYLEAGGTGPVYVAADASLDQAVEHIINGAFTYAGQLCVATQSVYADPSVIHPLRERLAAAVKTLSWGNPEREDVLAGPVIDLAARARLESLRDSALAAGARIVVEAPSSPDSESSGTSYVKPLLFDSVPWDHPLISQEVFGPYLSLLECPRFEDFVTHAQSAASRFQVAIHTQSRSLAQRAIQQLSFGSVIINEKSSLRLESMPFGGQGLTGLGREGPRFAIEDYCEIKNALESFN